MIGGLEALLGGALLAVAGAVVAYLSGMSVGKRSERTKIQQGYIETRRKADEADIVDDADGARGWLRDRPADQW